MSLAYIIATIRAAEFSLGEATARLSDNEDGPPDIPCGPSSAREFPRGKWWFYNRHTRVCRLDECCSCAAEFRTAQLHMKIHEARRAYVPRLDKP